VTVEGIPALRIAIDIGSHAVKVVWTTSSPMGGQKWHCAQRPYQADTVSSAAWTRLLRGLLRPLSRRRFTAPVVLVVPQSHLRQVVLSVTELARLSEALQAEVPRLFPFDPARAIARFRLLSQQRTNGTLACTLQVAACDAQVLQRDLEAICQVGWVPSQAYPAALAVEALARAQGHLGVEPVAFVEVGARHSIIGVASNGSVIFAREVASGSDALTEALMAQVQVGEEGVQLSREEAESLKQTLGIPSSELAVPPVRSRLPVMTYQAMLQPVLEQWLSEIQRTIAFSLQSHPEAEPTALLLCGGGSQLAGLDRWVGAQLGIKVQRLSVESYLGTDLSACSVAVGALLAEDATAVSLLPKSTQQTRQVIRGQRKAMQVLLGVGLVLWLGIIQATSHATRLRQQLAPLEQRWHALEPVTAVSTTMTNYSLILQTLVAGQEASVKWFRNLTDGFPDPVRLTALTVTDEGAVELAGQAEAREQAPEASVSELAMWLEQQGLCHRVHLGASERNPQHQEQVDFNLTCRR